MEDNWHKQDGSVSFPHKAVVWLGHRGRTNAPPLPVLEERWFSDIRATLADEEGEEWEMRSGTAQFRPSTVRGRNGVSSWDFTSYPRRGRTLRFRMYARNNSDGWDTLADFNLSNPTPGPYPVWKPSNLPVTRTNGDLNVSLVGLISGTKAVQYYPVLIGRSRRATFEVKENGRLTEAWLADRMEATDATANEPWVPMVTYGVTNNLAFYEIRGTSLSPSEVWKLRVRLAKEKEPAPKQVWTSPDLVVENGALSPVTLTTNLQTGPLTLECLQAPFHNTIRLNVNPLPKDTRLRLAEIVDNQGRKVEYASGGIGDSGFDAQWKIPAGAKWIRVSIRLVETRAFEFVAQPTRQNAGRGAKM